MAPTTGLGAMSSGGVTLIVGLLFCVAALVLRIGLLMAPPEFDELYHLLAARSWTQDGTLAILDGEYVRGRLFTIAIGEVFGATGRDDLLAARLVPLVAGCLIPAVLFLWVRAVAGLGAGLLAGGFALVWPQGILESQLARFYSAHVLFFLLGAIAFYMAILAVLMHRNWGIVIGWAVATALAWGVAAHLQISTVIGIAGAMIWAVPTVLFDRVRVWRQRWLLILGAAVLCCVVGLAALLSGTLEKAWAVYRWTPMHAVSTRDFAGYYHLSLTQMYQTFWPLFPVLAVLALSVHRRLTLFAGTLFVFCFLAHSFGGMKSARYLSYAMPFVFAIWAMGLAACLPPVVAALRKGVLRAVPELVPVSVFWPIPSEG